MFKTLLGAAAALTLLAVAPAAARKHDRHDRNHYSQDRGHGYDRDRGNRWHGKHRGRYFHNGRYYQSRYRRHNVWVYR
jgi:Ni/Co efflux regulator RcnB